MPDSIPVALVRKRQFLSRTGLSNSTFYNRIKEGAIKPGVPVGPRIKAWPESEVQAYIQSCIEARDSNVASTKAQGAEPTNNHRPAKPVSAIPKSRVAINAKAPTARRHQDSLRKGG